MLFVVCCMRCWWSLFVVSCCLLFVGCWFMSVVCCLRWPVHCSQLVVVGSLFVGDWRLLVVLCRLRFVDC